MLDMMRTLVLWHRSHARKPPGLPAPPGSGGTVRERIFRERCPEVYDGLQKSYTLFPNH